MGKKERVKQAYNRTAKTYNSRYRVIQFDKYKTILSSLPIAINSNHKILDLGCGIGLLFEFLKERSNFADVIGLDISKEMLKFSTEEKILGDVENLPFKNNSFDFIFSFTVIQNLPSYKIFKEVKRVLKPKCSFIFTVLKKKCPERLLEKLGESKLAILKKLDCNEDLGVVCRNEK